MDISVVIVNWNTKSILRDCLKSVYEQTKSVNFEVIVIDNASADGSVDMIKNDFSQVILIKNKKNKGFAAANNQGIAKSKGRYILLLNSDTVILDKAIQKVIDFADSHPQAAVTGCRVLNPDKTLQPTCFMFPSVLNMLLSTSYLYKLFPKNKFFGRERMTWWDRTNVRQVDVATGCFMLIRCDAIEQIGTMDEQFFMYAEETDFCFRIKQAGYKNMFTPDAQIIHLGGQSTDQVKKAMTIQKQNSILQFIKKHNGPFVYRTACLLTVLFFAIRLPVWSVIAFLQRTENSEAAIKRSAYFTSIVNILFGWIDRKNNNEYIHKIIQD